MLHRQARHVWQTDTDPQRGRRRVLKASLGLLAMGALRPPLQVWAADAASPFLTLSQRLTGRPSLSAELSRRYQAALARRIPDFAAGVTAVLAYLQPLSGPLPADLPARLRRDLPRYADIPRQIVAAWYLGQVGHLPDPDPSKSRSEKDDGHDATVVAYELALMEEPVRDVLTLPSYCRDVPGYWARRPA